jgi:hypothetical protein
MAHDQPVLVDVGEAFTDFFDGGEQIGLIFRPADKRRRKRTVSAQTVDPDAIGTTGDVYPLNTGVGSVKPAGIVACVIISAWVEIAWGKTLKKRRSSGNSERFGKRTSGVKSELSMSLSFTSAPAIMPNSTGLPRESVPFAPQCAVVKCSNAEAPVCSTRVCWGKIWSKSILNVAFTWGSMKTS